jgi:hypothetical protein
MTKKTLLKKLGEIYGDGWPQSREDARENGSGDGLAAFIYLELDEVLSDKKVDLEDAEILMARAAAQVQEMVYKIQEFAK